MCATSLRIDSTAKVCYLARISVIAISDFRDWACFCEFVFTALS